MNVIDKKQILRSPIYFLLAIFHLSSSIKATLQVCGNLCSSCRCTKWRKSLPVMQLIRAKHSSSYTLKLWYDLTLIPMNILYVYFIQFVDFTLCIPPFYTFGENGEETDVWSVIRVSRVQSIFFATGSIACALPCTSLEVDSMPLLGSKIKHYKRFNVYFFTERYHAV